MRNKAVWSDKAKIELFGLKPKCHFCRKPGPAYHLKNITLMVRHGGASIMLRGCFSVAGTWRLLRVEGKINVAMYGDILDKNKNYSRVFRTSDWDNDSLYNRTTTQSTQPM